MTARPAAQRSGLRLLLLEAHALRMQVQLQGRLKELEQMQQLLWMRRGRIETRFRRY